LSGKKTIMIHKKAIVQKGALLDEGVKVGAYSIIESGATIEKDTVISPYVHIKGNCSIGRTNFIGTGSVIGTAAQMLGQRDAKGKVYIGKNNIIREYVTINAATENDKATSIGDNNYFMSCSHLAHDCKVADEVVICNGSLVAGHVEIQDKAFISGNAVIHQFVRVGKLVMIGGLSRVNQDIPPFLMVVGDSRVCGLNLVGLRRAGFKREDVNNIKKAFSFLYRKDLALKTALINIERIDSDKTKEMLVFILASSRGICGPRRSNLWEKLFLDYPYLVRTKVPTYDSLPKPDLKEFEDE